MLIGTEDSFLVKKAFGYFFKVLLFYSLNFLKLFLFFFSLCRSETT